MNDFERIDLLASSGFITSLEADALRRVIRIIREDAVLSEACVDISPLVTHLASAMRRMRLGEHIDVPDDTLKEDMRANGILEQATRLEEEIESVLSAPLDEAERIFVVGHCGSLFMQVV